LIDRPNALEHTSLLAARIKLFERQVSVLIDVATQVNASTNFLVELAAGKLVAGAHEFHLQVERRADRAFEAFCFGNDCGAALCGIELRNW